MADPAATAFARIAEGLRPVAEAARAEICKAGPNLREELKWGVLCFSGRKLVCAIAGHKTHLNLQFYRGVEADPAGAVLEGTGKLMRHFKMHTAADAKRPELLVVLKTAVALDGAGA
jgi:hypothetical protein